MIPSMKRNARSGLSRRTGGQAMVEYVTLTAGLLLGAFSLMTFAPDSVRALTIYIQGFYLVLGLPLG
jgi:hypothetical protein